MTRNKIAILVLSLLAALALAGCGGQDQGAVESVEDLDVSALPDSVDVDTVAALRDNPDVLLLDVREPDEYEAGHIPGIMLIPMGEVADRLSEIPQDKTIIVTCRSGNRSAQIADLLRSSGYSRVHNMEGGLLAWLEAGHPVE